MGKTNRGASAFCRLVLSKLASSLKQVSFKKSKRSVYILKLRILFWNAPLINVLIFHCWIQFLWWIIRQRNAPVINDHGWKSNFVKLFSSYTLSIPSPPPKKQKKQTHTQKKHVIHLLEVHILVLTYFWFNSLFRVSFFPFLIPRPFLLPAVFRLFPYSVFVFLSFSVHGFCLHFSAKFTCMFCVCTSQHSFSYQAPTSLNQLPVSVRLCSLFVYFPPPPPPPIPLPWDTCVSVRVCACVCAFESLLSNYIYG